MIEEVRTFISVVGSAVAATGAAGFAVSVSFLRATAKALGLEVATDLTRVKEAIIGGMEARARFRHARAAGEEARALRVISEAKSLANPKSPREGLPQRGELSAALSDEARRAAIQEATQELESALTRLRLHGGDVELGPSSLRRLALAEGIDLDELGLGPKRRRRRRRRKKGEAKQPTQGAVEGSEPKPKRKRRRRRRKRNRDDSEGS